MKLSEARIIRLVRFRLLGIIVSTACSGCMSVPFDGMVIPSRNSPIRVAGVHPLAGSQLTVEAYNFVAGRFEAVGSATAETADRNAYERFGSLWYPWSTNITLDDPVYWAPGTTGWFARLRTRVSEFPVKYAVTLQRDSIVCFAINGGAAPLDAALSCRSANSPVVTVVTNDYQPTPTGARRGPGLPRRLEWLDDDNTVLGAIELRTETTSGEIPEGTSKVRWRGDAAGFLDIFDRAYSGVYLGTEKRWTGNAMANFLRLHYPYDSNSEQFAEFDIDDLIAKLGVTPFQRNSWRGSLTWRQYDIGECSMLLKWRELHCILKRILDDKLWAGLDDVGLRGIGHGWALDLQPLRRRGRDAIGLYGFSVGSMYSAFTTRIWFHTTVSLGLSEETGALEASVGDSRVRLRIQPRWVNGYPVRPPFSLHEVGAKFGDSLQEVARELVALTGGAPLAGVHARPEGLELVFISNVENEAWDCTRGFLVRPWCDRPNPSTQPPFTGLFAPIIAGLSSLDYPVYGDLPRDSCSRCFGGSNDGAACSCSQPYDYCCPDLCGPSIPPICTNCDECPGGVCTDLGRWLREWMPHRMVEMAHGSVSCSDDGLACTDDVCNSAMECTHVNNRDDDNLCTSDICGFTGACSFIVGMCPTGEVCNPDTGECEPE